MEHLIWKSEASDSMETRAMAASEVTAGKPATERKRQNASVVARWATTTVVTVEAARKAKDAMTRAVKAAIAKANIGR